MKQWSARLAAALFISTAARVTLGAPPSASPPPPPDASADAKLLFRQGRLREAILAAEGDLAAEERAHGAQHPRVAASLHSLAVMLYKYGSFERAEALHERALAIRQKTLGPGHPEVAASLTALAMVCMARTADYARAEALLQRALAIRSKALGPAHADTAETLGALGWLYYQRDDHARAGPLLQRALETREKELGPEHPQTAESINDLALHYENKGDFTRAMPLFERALAVLDRTLGPEHPETATTISNIATLYRTIGDYAGAERAFLRAIAIRERTLGAEHPEVALTLSYLANLYREMGLYSKAGPLFERALSIQERVFRQEHPDVALSLYCLALLRWDQGRYASAEQLLTRALATWEKASGPESSTVGIALNALADLSRARGRLDRAEPLYRRALATQDNALGRGSTLAAIVQRGLAELYRERGDFERAEPLYQSALDVWTKALGPESLQAAALLQGLADLGRDRGDLGRAGPLYDRALAIREKMLGPDHPLLAGPLTGLAALRLRQGDTAGAVSARARAARIQDWNAGLVLATGAEEQKLAYMALLRDDTDATVSLHARSAPADPGAARLALTTILSRKGRVLDAMADGIAALRRHLTPEGQALLDRLSLVQSELAARVSRGPGSTPAEAYRARVAELERERQRLEDEVGRSSAAFRAEHQTITLDQVQAAIPDDAALVELFSYRPFHEDAARPADRWGEPRYAAYALRRRGGVAFADLGEAAPIDAAVERLRAALADPKRDPRPPARALDARLMQPIRGLLGGAQRLLVSPDGALHLVPFGALLDEEGRYLVERFSFTYVASGRDLLRLGAPAPPRQEALVLGAPDFGRTGAPPRDGPEGKQRGLRAAAMADVRFPPLPQTAEEARTVGEHLPGARVLTGAEATEAALKAARGPRVVHIATHGFFLPGDPAAPPDDRRGPGASTAADLPPSENPLLRAGLAFAGANARESGADDGVLTALEASGLDLEGTQLVVLSACETGMGKATTGEGVYGLRRALVMAGAEAQVMSLWAVDDEATRRLMEGYYRALQAGGGRSEALRQVALEMRRDPATAHPYYWAGFILSGDGSPMAGPRLTAPAAPRVPPGPRGCACGLVGAEGEDGAAAAALLAALAAAARRLRSRSIAPSPKRDLPDPPPPPPPAACIARSPGA